MPAKFISLVGQRFGLLRVVEHVGFNERRQSMYRCECACHEFVTVRRTDLTSGDRRRCSTDCKFQKERPVFRVSTIDGRGGESTRFAKG